MTNGNVNVIGCGTGVVESNGDVEILGDLTKWGPLVVFEKETEHLWIEQLSAGNIEHALEELDDLIVQRNNDPARCGAVYTRQQFAIAKMDVAYELANKTSAFIRCFDGYIPSRGEQEEYHGLANLLHILYEMPDVASAFSPSVFSALGVLKDAGLRAVLCMYDDEGDEWI